MSERVSTSRRITDEVSSWDGISAGYGQRGEFAFRLGKREIGHLHGDRAAHFFFHKDQWAKLMAEGRVTEHPVFPNRVGPAERRIRTEEDVADATEDAVEKDNPSGDI